MNLNDLTNFVGMPIELIAFEQGLTLKSGKLGWITHTGSRTGPVSIDPDEVTRRFLPVLVRCRPTIGEPSFTLLLHPNGGFSPQVPPFALFEHHLYHGAAIHYMAGALVYHVDALHSRYEIIRDYFKDISLIPGARLEDEANFQGQPEPYYEFDALLTVARRAYDTCRYVLWSRFGPEKGASSIPRSFEKTIPLCTNLDSAIRDDLQRSWNNWGSTLTSYRDCIMHYCPVDFGLATVSLRQEFPAIWTAWARIPDNPDARSKANFTFRKRLDALKFGWYLANEVLRVFRIVVDAVAKIESSQP